MEPVAGVKRVELGETGIDYVRDALGSRGSLAESLDALDLGAGIATTLLPSEIPEVPRRLSDEPAGLSKDGLRRIGRATKDKILAHFVGSDGRGWAMIEEPNGVGLGAFIKAAVDGRETRFKVATAGGSDILYLWGAAYEIDIEDFLDAAIDYGVVSALGVGGPITTVEPDSVDWEEDVLPYVVEHVRFITTQAFDGQALVFWERSAISNSAD